MKGCIAEFKIGEIFMGDFMIVAAETAQAANGPYAKLTISDGDRTVVAKRWQTDQLLPVGTVWQLRGNVGSYQGNLDIKISGWVPGDTPAADFLPASLKEAAGVYQEQYKLLQSITDEDLRNGVLSIYDEYADLLHSSPAAKAMHHTRPGELIKHLYEVTKIASEAATIMGVNRDHVIAGAALHDIGKTRTYTAPNGVSEMTLEGQLLDHIIIGINIIQNSYLTEPHRLMLSHMIASHHGSYAFGSPVLPKTAEASLVYYADEMSAKVDCFKEVARTNTSGDFAPKHFALGVSMYTGDFHE